MAEQTAPAMNTFAWNELMTTDPAACTTFFTGLLGWDAEVMPFGEDGTYTVFKQDGANVAGMMTLDENWGPVPPHWMGYISVEDVDAKAEAAVKLGGELVVPPTDIPNIGRFTMIKDPTGAVVSLITFVSM